MLNIVIDSKNNKAVAYVDNKQVGICEYIREENTWNITHTEVNKEYQGQGIARKLVQAIIEEATKQNKKIIADCSYAAKVINNK